MAGRMRAVTANVKMHNVARCSGGVDRNIE
jgi:hypothetical protein